MWNNNELWTSGGGDPVVRCVGLWSEKIKKRMLKRFGRVVPFKLFGGYCVSWFVMFPESTDWDTHGSVLKELCNKALKKSGSFSHSGLESYIRKELQERGYKEKINEGTFECQPPNIHLVWEGMCDQ